MVNNKLLHEVVMNFIPTKKGITSNQLEVKFKGPLPQLGKPINGGSKIKENNNEIVKVESLKKHNNEEILTNLGGKTPYKKQNESFKKNNNKPTESLQTSIGGNTIQKQANSFKKNNTKSTEIVQTQSGGNSMITNQIKIESLKNNNIHDNKIKTGGRISKTNTSYTKTPVIIEKKNKQNNLRSELSKKNIKNNTQITIATDGGNSKINNGMTKLQENQKKTSIGVADKSIKNQTTEIINNYKPSVFRYGGDSQKKQQVISSKNNNYNLVKEYIIKNGGQITNNNEQNITKNSYRSITIPIDTKNKSSKKNGGKKKTSKSKKRSSKKKSNIKIKSSAPNNLKNDIDNLIRSSKKMAFHRVY